MQQSWEQSGISTSSQAVVGCHGGEGQDCHPWYQTPSLSPDISNINSGSWTRNDCKYCTLSDRVWIKYLHCNVTIINAIKQIEYGPYTGNRQHLVQFYVSVRSFLKLDLICNIFVTCICLRHCRMLMYWKMEGTINSSLPSWNSKVDPLPFPFPELHNSKHCSSWVSVAIMIRVLMRRGSRVVWILRSVSVNIK